MAKVKGVCMRECMRIFALSLVDLGVDLFIVDQFFTILHKGGVPGKRVAVD